MTHPLRFKEPYAPKVGEWWECLKSQRPIRIMRGIEGSYCLVHMSHPLANCARHLDDLPRRHFRDQYERDNVPAIPPVEGARMIQRNGDTTDTMYRFDAESMTDGGLIWRKDGAFITNKGHDPSMDTIAVHTWPEVPHE